MATNPAYIGTHRSVFECSGVRGRILHLQSIPPTSVEAERVFYRCRDTLYKDSFAPQWRYAG